MALPLFEALLNRFFEIITKELSYCRWWKIGNEKYNKINSLLKEFIEYYTSKNDIVCYYTVNYDLLTEFATKLKFFKGFVKGGFNLRKVMELLKDVPLVINIGAGKTGTKPIGDNELK